MLTQQTVREIQQLMGGWTGRTDERRILTLLAACEGSALDGVLRQLNLHRLVRNLHDRKDGPDHRTQLLQLLTMDRVHDLSIDTRVAVVWALQRGPTRRSFEIAIRNVILASTGDDLRQLRNTLNLSETHRDLPRLVFKDIDDEVIRSEILEHIHTHQGSTDELKVLSDIDDTVFARLHDRRYPGKTRYPGVLAFFGALNQATEDSGNITFVTARPGILGGMVAAWTRRSLQAAGVHRFTILTGSIRALLSHRRMAVRKLVNIQQYHQVFPEYGLVFVGDSGQGDVLVGRDMLRMLPDVVRGVFIHDVAGVALRQPDQLMDPGIEFFDTYITAAVAAWQGGIISRDQAVQVSQIAIQDVERLTFLPPQTKRDRLHEHRHDLDVLQQMMRLDDTKKT